MNKKYTFSVLFFLTGIVLASAQEAARISTDKCGTMQRLELKLQRNTELKARFLQQQETFARTLSQRTSTTNKEQETKQTVTIPVVFHIVAPNPATVTDAQIQAQLDTLNKDLVMLVLWKVLAEKELNCIWILKMKNLHKDYGMNY